MGVFWVSSDIKALTVECHNSYSRSITEEDPIREVKMAIKRDETCICAHGDTFQYAEEDRTVDNGCERRGCPCTWWPILFENTATKISKWYSVNGAPIVNCDGHPSMKPTSARFTFSWGEECTEMMVYGRVVLKNGTVSDVVRKIDYIYHWDQQTWPQWLHDLYKLAMSEQQAQARRSMTAA